MRLSRRTFCTMAAAVSAMWAAKGQASPPALLELERPDGITRMVRITKAFTDPQDVRERYLIYAHNTVDSKWHAMPLTEVTVGTKVDRGIECHNLNFKTPNVKLEKRIAIDRFAIVNDQRQVVSMFDFVAKRGYTIDADPSVMPYTLNVSYDLTGAPVNWFH